MSDVVEVSYTGDILAHRRCPRAWAYESYAGFAPYEQVQAMEGRLLHHAMEWMARRYEEVGRHPTQEEMREQLERHWKVLRSRGITTTFETREKVLDRIQDNLFSGRGLRRPVRAVVEGAQHTEYELRAVRKVLPARFAGKERILLTGVIDLVLQQQDALEYQALWRWTDVQSLQGEVQKSVTTARPGDREIWDFKATRSGSRYLLDYVRQVVTYAALYRDRTGELPARCVLFFVNEKNRADSLLAIPVDSRIVDAGLAWTERQVEQLRGTATDFESNPGGVDGGSLALRDQPVGARVDDELRQQCTACAQRFDCKEYTEFLRNHGRGGLRDVDPLDVFKN